MNTQGFKAVFIGGARLSCLLLLLCLLPNAAVSQTVCAGSNFTIQALNFQNLSNKTFSLNPGGFSSLSPQFVVSPTVNTNYTVYTTGTNTANVTVTTASVILLQVLPQPIIAPTYTQYSCGTFTNGFDFHLTFNPPSPVPTYTVMWAVMPPQMNILMPNGITSVQQYSLVGAILPGLYAGVVMANGGCSTNVASFTMQPIPTTTLISIVASPSIICAGDSTTLTVSGATSYTWGNGSNQNTIGVLPTSPAHNFSVTGFNTNTCVGTRYYYPSFYPEAGFIVLPDRWPVCVGESAVYVATTTAASYTWIAGSATTAIAITPTAFGLYTATTISTDGCKMEYQYYISAYHCTSNHKEENSPQGLLFNVFPNPVSDKLHLEFWNAELEDVKLYIQNALGQTVFTADKMQQMMELDLSLLSAGIYYVSAQSETRRKVIKILKE